MSKDAASRISTTEGLQVVAPIEEGWAEILSPEALAFLEKLVRAFDARREGMLDRRVERQREIDQGQMPDFLSETLEIRRAGWTTAPVPDDLQDRRVEITGPVDRKMIINALNSGANVFMADFEDSNSPLWKNTVEGQVNLRDAVRRAITFTNPQGKRYALNDDTAVLMVRPRGLHLVEKHIHLNGRPISSTRRPASAKPVCHGVACKAKSGSATPENVPTRVPCYVRHSE